MELKKYIAEEEIYNEGGKFENRYRYRWCT